MKALSSSHTPSDQHISTGEDVYAHVRKRTPTSQIDVKIRDKELYALRGH